MPSSPKASDRKSPTGTPTLAERVRARVALAERRLARRTTDSNAAHKHLRPTRMKTPPKATLSNISDAEREARCLRLVFREMRTTYRSYRREAGTPAVPELRTAVHAFKRGQSIASLVEIASFLDERKLLAW